MQPKISVLIPIYNVEKYLRESLDSVVSQTCKDFEIICINDGSTDSSLSIIKEYAARDCRIQLIDKENSGYGDSMNRGLDSAKGKYIAILEPDDFIDSTMLEKLYGIAESKQYEFVKGDFYTFRTFNETKQLKYVCSTTEISQYQTDLSSKDVVQYLLCDGGFVAHWSGIYSASFLRQHKIRFNPTPGASFQDCGFFYKVLYCVKKWYLIPFPVYYYRQDNPNSSIQSKDKLFCIHQEFRSIHAFMEENDANASFFRSSFIMTQTIHYFFNFHRVAPQYRIAVAQEIKNDFKMLIRKNQMDYSNISLTTRIRLRLILFSPKLFCFISKIWNGKDEK